MHYFCGKFQISEMALISPKYSKISLFLWQVSDRRKIVEIEFLLKLIYKYFDSMIFHVIIKNSSIIK